MSFVEDGEADQVLLVGEHEGERGGEDGGVFEFGCAFGRGFGVFGGASGFLLRGLVPVARLPLKSMEPEASRQMVARRLVSCSYCLT